MNILAKNLMKNFTKTLPFCLGVLTLPASATLYLDLEEDSIPVVSVSVMIPVGFQAYAAENSGIFNLLPEIFDQGSKNLDRKKFFEQMAGFGANSGISVQNESTIWTLDFPYIKDKDYSPMFQMLADQMAAPRFEEETLKLAKLKMTASLQASLDSDSSMVRTTAVRLRAFKDFASFPVLMDSLEKISLAQVQTAYGRDYLKAMDGWSGVVAPKDLLPIIEEGLTKIFPNLGSIKRGVKKTPLTFAARKTVNLKSYEAAIIIDRPDRTQTLTSYTWLKAGTTKNMKSALSQAFGNYVLAESGLNSYFGDEIRNKRGLAYAVGGIDDVYLGNTVIGLAANPQRARNSESTDVFGELVKNAYEEANVFPMMSADEWKTRFKSYQYDWILSERTADGRLARRASLIDGDVYPELALTSPSSWSIDQKDASEFFKKQFSGSSRILVLVGDAKELTPIIGKAFPSMKVIAVPYKEMLKTETYQKLISQF